VQFLAPIWLALAGAAAVPLLLHLLRRRVGTRIDFPAARYLARAEQESSAKLRLRNWLLMALRVLAVLLVALAAARPVADLGSASHAPTALAVVLDNSLSTTAVADGRPVLDALRAEAVRVLAGAGTADRVWLVTADGRVTGGSVSAVRDAVGRVPALAGAGNLAAAVSRAAALVQGAGAGAPAVVVLTDGQASAWTSAADVGAARTTIVRAVGDAPRNRAVIDAAARPARWSPGGEAWARLAAGDTSTWRVVLTDTGGREVGSARGTAPPNGEVRVALRPTATGWLSGAVSVQPDELRGDDVRHFAVLVGAPPAVRADATAARSSPRRSPHCGRRGACARAAAPTPSPSASRASRSAGRCSSSRPPTPADSVRPTRRWPARGAVALRRPGHGGRPGAVAGSSGPTPPWWST
jgi:hypothetical protein